MPDNQKKTEDALTGCTSTTSGAGPATPILQTLRCLHKMVVNEDDSVARISKDIVFLRVDDRAKVVALGF